MSIHEHPVYLPLQPNTTLWRYISVPKLEMLLRDKALFFCRADKFTDIYEGTIPQREADFRLIAEKQASDFYQRPFDEAAARQRIAERAELHQRFRRGTVVNCWQMSGHESDGMWQQYLKDNEGVAIKASTESMHATFEPIETGVEMSRVRYLDYERDTWYHPEHFPHRSYNMITPLFHKRIEFSHENEFRIFHTIQEAIDEPEYWGDRKGINISIAPERLIEQIVLHPMAGVEVTARVRELVVTYGYDLPIVTSRLSEPPIF
jgi:hypothetical protein